MQTHANCYLGIGPPPGVKSISGINRRLLGCSLVSPPFVKSISFLSSLVFPPLVLSISFLNRLPGAAVYLPVILRGVLGISFLNRPLSLEHLLRKSFLRLVPLRSEVESLSLALANARTLCANRERLEGSLI